MPTLFRLIFVVGVVFTLGYGALFATATFLKPQPRTIVQAIALPQDSELRSGRSAAETLNTQASALVRHGKGHVAR